LPSRSYQTKAQRVCDDFSVEHRVQPTLRQALGSHYRHLRCLGQA